MSDNLAWLHCPHDSKLKLLMFAAFFDDSGTDPKSRICLFAGYAAPKAEWDVFRPKWRALLDDAGVRYFRAADCVRGFGLFEGMPEAARMEYHRRAVDIIVEHKLTGFAVAGRRQDFGDEFGDWPAATAYECSVRYGLLLLGLHAGNTWFPEKVAVVCEQGKPADVRAVVNVYLDLIEDEKFRYLRSVLTGPPAFHAKEDHLELQAADVFAYECAREMARWIHNPRVEEPRTAWSMLAFHATVHGGQVQCPGAGHPLAGGPVSGTNLDRSRSLLAGGLGPDAGPSL